MKELFTNIINHLTSKSSRKYYLVKREFRFYKQRRKQGFTDYELYNLFGSISRLIEPRLSNFAKRTCGWPIYYTEEEWGNRLNSMIEAFRIVNNSLESDQWTEDQYKNYKKGMTYFSEDFLSLWY